MHNWTRTGRTEYSPENPLKRRWTGGCGERNVLHTGTQAYAPYLVSDTTAEVHGCGIDYVEDRVTLLANRELDMSVSVEAWRGSWVDVPAGHPLVDLISGFEMLTGKITYADAPYSLELQHYHGKSSTSSLRTLFSAKTDETIRFKLHITGVINPRRVRFGFISDDFSFRWEPFEDPDHSVEFGHESATITIGPFDYKAGESLDIYPIQYGPTTIVAQADDGNEDNSPAWSDTGGWFGNNLLFLAGATAGSDEPIYVGWTWFPDLDTGAGVASIDATTQIATINPGNNSTPTDITGSIEGVDANQPAAFGAGANLPSARTVTTASTSITGATGNQNFDVQSIVSELVVTDGYTYEAGANDRMMFIANTSVAGNSWWSVSGVNGGTGTAASLEINYTATGGGRIMSSLANHGGLAGMGGIAGSGGGIAG